MTEKVLRYVIFYSAVSTLLAFGQIPDRKPNLHPYSDAHSYAALIAAQDILVAEHKEPLVIPAGIVGWISASVVGALLGLGGIIYKRHNDDIKELKQNHKSLGEKVDRHFESIMQALGERRRSSED